jgi:hypothetical protein
MIAGLVAGLAGSDVCAKQAVGNGAHDTLVSGVGWGGVRKVVVSLVAS